VRVLTFNVLSPDLADWPRRRRVIADGIRRLEPDVVALQEVVDEAELLGGEWHVARHPSRSEDPVGAVLASDHFGVVADLEPPQRAAGAWD
jgi:endonuclease/exonuclease/phosphatase family metal-dependent hydrolase